MNISYTKHGDYLLPNLILKDKEQFNIGKYGLLRLEYIKKYNLPYAPVYGEIIQDDKGKWQTTKCNRTGCVFCMYGCHLEKEPNRFQNLKITHPKLWQY